MKVDFGSTTQFDPAVLSRDEVARLLKRDHLPQGSGGALGRYGADLCLAEIATLMLRRRRRCKYLTSVRQQLLEVQSRSHLVARMVASVGSG